ncbi:MAG: amidohydrolase [Actinobacteria bacterium]|nr:amidohydrolase [Actinomycetota bacterium]
MVPSDENRHPRRSAQVTGADLILLDGDVRTLDPSAPHASALAIADGHLIAVGDEAEAIALRRADTEVIDLGGAAVTPGIVDSHIHAFPTDLFLGGVDMTDAGSLDEVRAALAAAADRAGPGGWITGYGLDYELFAATGIHGSLLADAVGQRPAILQFVDLHTAVATPAALAAAGVTGPRHFEENAEIVCVEGVPTGELREPGALDLVAAAISEATEAEVYAEARERLGRLAAAGITGVHLMDGDLERLDLLRELEANGHLSVRVVTPFWLKPETEESEWERFAAAVAAGGRRWRGGVAKFFIDGVIDSGTAWLFEPDAEGAGTEPFWPDPSRYRKAVSFMAAAGFQCVTHACGDRAVREALDAYREATPSRRGNHRIEHVETIQADDLGRFAAEGITASMQAQHMMWLQADRSDNWSRRLGDERCARAFPTRTLLDGGAHVTLGSDWPVARLDPREGMAAARLRRPPGLKDWVPFDEQALSPLEALMGYTLWPAIAIGEEADSGTLVPGKRADITVFAQDPVTCDADELGEDEVLLTVVDGEVVHRSLD